MTEDPNAPRAAIYDPTNDPVGAKMADDCLAAKAKAELPSETPLITLDDFYKAKMKTAEVISAEPHPKADRLLVLQIRVGDKTKQIVAGIRQHYGTHQGPPLTIEGHPEIKPLPSIVGKTIIIVDNLAPAKLRGIESNGMLLAVKTKDGDLRLLTVDGKVDSGLDVG